MVSRSMLADRQASRAASTSNSFAPRSQCSPKRVQPIPTMATRSRIPLLAMGVRSPSDSILPPRACLPEIIPHAISGV